MSKNNKLTKEEKIRSQALDYASYAGVGKPTDEILSDAQRFEYFIAQWGARVNSLEKPSKTEENFDPSIFAKGEVTRLEDGKIGHVDFGTSGPSVGGSSHGFASGGVGGEGRVSVTHDEPKLGLATTRELIDALAVRMDTDGNTSQGYAFGRTCKLALENLHKDVLNYRTVDRV